MPDAAPLLGLDVASTSTLFLVILSFHVAAATTAIAAGIVAMFAAKGSRRHRRAGRTYLFAVLAVFLSACVMAAFRWFNDVPLIVTGAVAAGSAIFGFLYRRFRRPGDAPHMLTAFYVDNGPHLPLWNLLPPVTFWFLPALVGIPLMTRAIRRARHSALQPNES